MQLEDRRFGTGYKSYMGFARLGADVMDAGAYATLDHGGFNSSDTAVVGGVLTGMHAVAGAAYGITAWCQACDNGGTMKDAKRKFPQFLAEVASTAGWGLITSGHPQAGLPFIVAGMVTSTLAQGA